VRASRRSEQIARIFADRLEPRMQVPPACVRDDVFRCRRAPWRTSSFVHPISPFARARKRWRARWSTRTLQDEAGQVHSHFFRIDAQIASTDRGKRVCRSGVFTYSLFRSAALGSAA
jgi:hypothetical protein